ncbi:HORMA domain-containing protein 2 isoform X2 [Melanerpes formicivorus]|uniref:HORMA domain-containing protein 2 isoform X2 n=1 Tax=Melanerpes formicivorus TaxID=211600 RepID=UPI00358E1DF5
MAAQQLLQTRQKKRSSKSVVFPSKICTEQQSAALVKQLLAISVSCITYMRGLFPENSYGTQYLDDLCLKVLREDRSCLGSLQIVKWLQGCFDALERQYLHIAVLAIYTNPKEPETVTELYQFKFKYIKEVPQMDIISPGARLGPGLRPGPGGGAAVGQACRLLLRKLYLLLQNLGPLPSDVTLTMKLLYYSDVTPEDYQPPGFKEDGSPGDLLFDGDPVNLRMGSVSTGFHLMKLRVTAEKKRMVERSLTQEKGPTEISHQGLDCEEEEEEGSTEDQPLPIRADSRGCGEDKGEAHPGRKMAASSYLQDPGGGKPMGVQETGRMLRSRASQQMSCLDLGFSQEEVTGPRKKRKVSEPEKPFLEGRK